MVWATGPDTTLDGVFRLQALRRNPEGEGGGWERFDRFCRPFPDSDREAATARMLREYGVSAADLEQAPVAEEAFGELAAFLQGGPVLAADRESFLAWCGSLAGEPVDGAAVLGVADLAALLLPGRLSAEHAPVRTPEDLRGVIGRLVGRFLALDETTLRLAASGWAVAWRGLLESDPPSAERLELALALVEHPSALAGDTGELFAIHEGLREGGLSAAASAGREPPDPELVDLAEAARRAALALRPRCAEVAQEWARFDTVAVDADEPAPFDEAERDVLDDVFQVFLPASFEGGPGAYRKGQHEVAHEVAATLGAPELLLVHAPTGTGKTLSYLVPALLWAARREVRVGISTYTRALQEQAMDIEVPRALRALGRAGISIEPRVSLLKGRANYLCWRALRLHTPSDQDEAETWMAWIALCLFARTDEDGDLDRLPMRPPLGSGEASRRELASLVRAVRAETGCCAAREDRETCAAETARARAERSHVVVTNHSFALARQGFFKRIVFDECEHLHEQAHAAFSHMLSTREVREVLGRLRQPDRPVSRAPLDRLERVVPPGCSASRTLEACVAAWRAMLAGLEQLERAIEVFKRWRDVAQRERAARDRHSLLREYVEADGDQLLAARVELHTAGTSLEAELCGLAGELDSVPASGMPRMRRSLERARTALVEVLDALEAWIPLENGAPLFRQQTFHDLDTDARGRDVMAARVLLPGEYLGRHYFPQLASAVLISATTWLRGGFESAAGYLGLDRAAHPAEDEEREPCSLRSFRAPDPFDYGRVLVCVPVDAPEYRDKRAFDEYVRRFIAHLGERSRGRMLVLFTNAEDTRRAGQELAGFFRARRIPCWYQRMPGHRKEELGELFRARVDSILMGVDTFWYGADFPGETLEYLVIVKLPWGVPDPYHRAQCAVLGESEQRRRIYMPRALGKLRQGFGRLMRRETDRGCVFVLDARVLQRRNAAFLGELPLAVDLPGGEEREWSDSAARLLTADTNTCLHEALAHMSMLADVERRGLAAPFESGTSYTVPAPQPAPKDRIRERPAPPEILDISTRDVPF